MESMVRTGPRRGDGAVTRAQLLEAAGEVIAEKGFERATGKEIAERAGSNSAAINYYFGGMEGLHGEVLVEAHRSLASVDELAAVAQGDVAPEEKLRQILGMAVAAATQPRERSWALRVLSREFISPSPARKMLEERELLPKKRLIQRVVAEVLGRPEDDPVVERCTYSVVAPITFLLVCEAESRQTAFPCLCGDGAEALVRHLHAFALGGIAAVKAAEAGRAGAAEEV